MHTVDSKTTYKQICIKCSAPIHNDSLFHQTCNHGTAGQNNINPHMVYQSTQTFSSSSFSSSSSELLSDGGTEDRLFVTSSIFGFTALFFLPRGFLLREFAYRAESTSVSVIKHRRGNEGVYELFTNYATAYFTFFFLQEKLML